MAKRETANLEGDGINELIFELLWTKDALNFSPQLNIPDTVVFRFGQPVQWYFTGSNGRIKRKNRQNLMNSKVEEVFTKQVLGYDVIATFVSLPAEGKKGSSDSNNSTPRVEYLDKAGLSTLLYKRQKEIHGILQRFIEPKSTHNELIRAIWSPKICMIERIQNVNQLQDHRCGIYERCVTLEGPDYYIESAPLKGPVLAGQIQNLCETVISHITEVTYSQQIISRMVLTLKLDARDKMWLIYSTSIRLYDTLSSTHAINRRLVNIDSVISLPDSIHLNPQRTFGKTVARETVSCISCARKVLEDLRYPVTYKHIVRHYDYFLEWVKEEALERGDGIMTWPPDKQTKKLIETCGGIGFGGLDLVPSDDTLMKTSKLNLKTMQGNGDLQIPVMLRYLHPRLSLVGFMGCKNDPLFLYKSTPVCEACYLAYAAFATMHLMNGPSLMKIRKPDPTSPANNPRSHRPTSADWKAMSSAVRDTFRAEEEQRAREERQRAIENSIGLRSSEERLQPTIPTPITQPIGVKGVMQALIGAKGGRLASGRAALSPVMSKDVEGAFDTSIAERERRFFNDISKNPLIRDHHPLMHLIASQKKLEDANISISTSESSSRMEGIFDKVYGHQRRDKFERLASYKVEIPYNINGMTVKPSQLRKMRAGKGKNASMISSLSPSREEKHAVNHVAQSIRHREFLDSTLSRIEREFS